MRLRLPRREFGGPQRPLFGTGPQGLLRGLAKLVTVVAAAAVAGLVLGVAIAKLSGNNDSSNDVASTRATKSTTAKTRSKSTSRRRTTRTTPSDAGARPALAHSAPANGVRVRVVSAILHPATLASRKRRRRARLSVHVLVTNHRAGRFLASRPELLSGNIRVKTDATQDSAATNLQPLAPRATADVTLRFEIAEDVTTRVLQQLRARLAIAGVTMTVTVKVGHPVRTRGGRGSPPSG